MGGWFRHPSAEGGLEGVQGNLKGGRPFRPPSREAEGGGLGGGRGRGDEGSKACWRA